jgi:tetratricopeptide (TPR) repeat protein
LSFLAAFGLLAMLALPLAVGAQSQPPAQSAAPAETDMNLFQRILQAGDIASRLTLVDQFLTTYPQSPYRANVLVAGAEAYRMMNNFEKAIEYGDQALASDPRNAVALLLVADALSEGSQPTQADYGERLAKAEDYSRRALEAIPTLFTPERRMAEPSPEEFDLREDFFEAMAHATLGYVHFRRDELPAAEQELKLATELNQFQPNAVDFDRLGLVQVKLKKLDAARDSFHRCVEVGGPAADTCARRLEMMDKMGEQERPKPPENPQE